MIERSAPSATLRSQSPDINKARAAADALLGPDGPLPRFDELTDRTARLRRHLLDLIPAVQDAAQALPNRDERRGPALDAVDGARVRLDASPGCGLRSASDHAKALAHELRALCDHHETLTGATVGGTK